MIYLTGDTHGGLDINKLLDKKTTSAITRDDYLIICGDFGFIWNYKKEDRKERKWLKWFEKQPWTTLFIDGNHECFPRLYTYPEKEWHGGKVHVIRDRILHLERGEVFEIEGKKIFAMGGAASHDRGPAVGDTKTVIGKYWWPEEIPSIDEMSYAMNNLEKNNHHVDYMITHCLPTSYQFFASDGRHKPDDMSAFLQKVLESTVFTHWYCGHYHKDRDLDKEVTVLFQKVIRLGDHVGACAPMAGNPLFHKGEVIQYSYQGKEGFAIVINVIPWGSLKDNGEPVYDIETEEGELIKQLRESYLHSPLRPE